MIYLYGLIEADSERSFGPIGFGGREVSILSHRDLAAVVSPSPFDSFDGLTREILLPHLFTHQFVVEKVMGEGLTVLPLKFGTVAQDREEVKRILREGYPRLKGALQAIQGQRELDVVAVWDDLQAVLQEIGDQGEIRRFKEALTSRPPQETLEERIQIGRMVKAALEEKRDRLAAEFLEVLKGLAAHIRCHDLLDDSMILNAAFLVDKGREEAFTGTLHHLDDRYDGWVDFRCIGPLPPYSFSTVEVKRIPVEAVEKARRLLGVAEGANLASVKKAYRQAAQRYHPDKTRSTPTPQPAIVDLGLRISDLGRMPPSFNQKSAIGNPQSDFEGGGGEGFQELKEAYQLLIEGFPASPSPGVPASDLIVIKVG